MKSEEIIAKLPYTKPFLFVDEIVAITENGVEGNFVLDEQLDFYQGHFKDHPVTPGVILIEIMAQIGLVSLGIFLVDDAFSKNSVIGLTATAIEFLKPVYPNEKVTVISEKIYFRFGKLKCKVRMLNQEGEEVCGGTIAGMLT